MSMSYRPRLTATQIDSLKSDIKFLSAAIYRGLTGHKGNKFPVAASQNAIARELGFTGFTELSSRKVPTEHHSDFTLASALTVQKAHNAYSGLKLTGGVEAKHFLTVESVSNALALLDAKSLEIDEPHLSLMDLYAIINADEYHHGHQYKEGDGYPSEFTVGTKTEFFDKLHDWDHFRVYDGKEYKCFTVNKFQYIYDKKITLFKVSVGRWFENGYCSGHK
ncbi:conserved hypothetical protein [Vibrio chagasii]|nr:conserved hypothetical protein [Vibrio chagasii]